MAWRWNEFRSFHMKSLSLILKTRTGNCHSKDSAVTRGSRFSEQLSSLLSSLFLKAEKSHEPVPSLLIYTKAPSTGQFGCNCLQAAIAGAQSSSLVPTRDGLRRPGGLRSAGRQHYAGGLEPVLESCLHKAITIHAVDAGVHCRYSPCSGGSHGEPHDASLKGPLEVPAPCLLVKAG